ncbi:uncharacterized protein LOC120356906 [Solenopsis invicta]|uniref:uncharacterized protein LOC120356906 n=1 Tax=Solenopsis invicta TaxID=13686 RepID=UPI00193DD577|nr:uncharacterized protein LOC120356906 [Solenopsis invicta]
MYGCEVVFNRVSHLLRCLVSRVSDEREYRECRKQTRCRAFMPRVNQEEENRREEDLGSQMFGSCGRNGAGRSDQRRTNPLKPKCIRDCHTVTLRRLVKTALDCLRLSRVSRGRAARRSRRP